MAERLSRDELHALARAPLPTFTVVPSHSWGGIHIGYRSGTRTASNQITSYDSLAAALLLDSLGFDTEA